AVLIDPPARYDETLGCRLERSWRTVHRATAIPATPVRDAFEVVVLAARPIRRSGEASPVGDLSGLQLPPRLGALPVTRAGSFEAPAQFACRAWRAFLVGPEGARPAGPPAVEPQEGFFDRRARTHIERLDPPAGEVVALQPQ
ncbi:MAG: hypothetical protein MI919_05825, partial [Holophagales bacterium]|nr:hypothetical protein [Holophagales bacterium]